MHSDSVRYPRPLDTYTLLISYVYHTGIKVLPVKLGSKYGRFFVVITNFYLCFANSVQVCDVGVCVRSFVDVT